MSTITRCDIAVVGGGPAGLAAALALGRSGFAVTLIAPLDRAVGPAGDPRTAALFTGSIELLKNLGVWGDCEAASAPLRGIRIVDDTGALFRAPEVCFTASELGLEAFGFNVPNATLTAALREGIEKSKYKVEARFGSSATKIEIGPDAARLELSDGSCLEARLVAGADGRKSISRDAAGIGTQSWTYPQAALTCSFEHGRPHNAVSTEFHRPCGPLTTVPLPGQRSSLVWVERPEEAQRLSGLLDDEFRAALEERLQGLLGVLGAITPRSIFPLSGLSADIFGRNRVALIGEAGHVIPPIGAQGLNLGMRDAAMLAACVEHARDQGEDIGGDTALNAYAATRKADVSSRVIGIDMLNRSLLAGIVPVHLLRGIGLYALNTFGPLRRLVVQQGLQPSFATPPLMRPGGHNPFSGKAPVEDAVVTTPNA